MQELLSNIVCSLIMTLLGFYIIKVITNSNIKFYNSKNLEILFLFAAIPCLIHNEKYSSLFSIIIFFLNTIAYKIIFKQNILEAIISTGIIMIITFIADILNAFIYIPFVPINILRKTWYLYIISNLSLAIICIIICNLKIIKKALNKTYLKLHKINYNSSIIFIIFIIIAFSLIDYNLVKNYGWNINYSIDLVIVMIFIILFVIFINEKIKTEKTNEQYDSLFSYVQNFEEWIEKEQLNRHEYKNQLAVLRCLTKEKKIKNKIDEILEDNINIEDTVINELKDLPKGGIKGLIYYKTAIAQNNKIHVSADISLKKNNLLKKIPDNKIKVLCRLIGIYFDNAIEAAKETKKKNVTIEIYEQKDILKIIISNNFNNIIDNINEKGVSIKGKGRGNGLYFASKIINNNKWISQKQQIIDDCYIQELNIKKPDTK